MRSTMEHVGLKETDSLSKTPMFHLSRNAHSGRAFIPADTVKTSLFRPRNPKRAEQVLPGLLQEDHAAPGHGGGGRVHAGALGGGGGPLPRLAARARHALGAAGGAGGPHARRAQGLLLHLQVLLAGCSAAGDASAGTHEDVHGPMRPRALFLQVRDSNCGLSSN